MIGEGGGGEVYRAVDTSLNAEVALKLLHPKHIGSRHLVERFLDEARKLVPYNNATSIQVVAPVLSGIIWALENPNEGIVEADEALAPAARRAPSASIRRRCAPCGAGCASAPRSGRNWRSHPPQDAAANAPSARRSRHFSRQSKPCRC